MRLAFFKITREPAFRRRLDEINLEFTELAESCFSVEGVINSRPCNGSHFSDIGGVAVKNHEKDFCRINLDLDA